MQKPARFLLLFLSAALAAARAQGPVDEPHALLTFPGNHFRFSVPVAAAGHLSVQLLDTEDTLRSSATASCAGAGACELDLPPASARPAGNFEANDLALYRLRYRFVPAGAAPVEGTLALAHIAPALFELHLAGPKQIRPGAPVEVRLRAVHPLTGAPLPHLTLTAHATADLEDHDADVELTRQILITDAHGFATVRLTPPAGAQLNSAKATVEGHLANLTLDASLELDAPGRDTTQLTTDKPLYQPGQTLHTRLLALDRVHHARPGQAITLEIIDPDDTLLYRTQATTSKYGIATADWQIPARLRLGQYRVKASPEEGQDAEATIRISQYDLPTFTVTPTPDRPFYLPGQDADVLVHADYLFGKPVLHGHVRVVRDDERKWNTDSQKYETRSVPVVEGDLDATGNFHAHLPLGKDEEDYKDADPGNDYADLHFAAYLTDASTNRTEPRRFDVRVTAQALHLYVIGLGSQTAGLPQQLFLAVTLADGTPAAHCTGTLALLPAPVAAPPGMTPETLANRFARAAPLGSFTTDARGLATLDLPAWQALQALRDSPTLYLDVHDPAGHQGALESALPEPNAALRVTVERPLLHPDDPIEVTVESALPDLPITLQVLRDTTLGGILLTSRAFTLTAGKATLTLPTDARFAGEVELNAVALRPLAGDVPQRYGGSPESSDSILTASTTVLFPRDNSLHVALHTDKPLYRAGEQATATLAVTGPQDPDGDDRHAAPAAVGLVAVDQAVAERNRTDSDFGERGSSFFFPGWSSYSANPAGGVTLAQLMQLDPHKPIPPDLELPTRILLAERNQPFNTESNAPSDNLAQVFSNVFAAQLFNLRAAFTDYLKTHPELPTDEPALNRLLATQHLDLATLRDPWGTPYTLTTSSGQWGQVTLELVSAGPDKAPDTGDEFTVNLASWPWFAVHLAQIKAAVDTFHAQTHGYLRDVPTLNAELRREGLEPTLWRSPDGRPITYTFEVDGSHYTLAAFSSTVQGSGRHQYENRYSLGDVSIEYFGDDRLRLQELLNTWSHSHPFPTDQPQLDAALAASGLTLAGFHDPWGNPVYATFNQQSTFGDRTTTEAGTGVAAHTVITPVTRVADVIQIRSHGPNAKLDSLYSILLASFTYVRSEQSAAEQAAHLPGSRTVRPGRTGGVHGTITDQTGAVIPGALAVLTDDTGFRLEAQSAADGTYALDPVKPGVYKLQVTSPGFMEFTYKDVHVASAAGLQLDVKLQVGAVAEVVMVTADKVTLETSSASMGSITVSAALMDLPMNGRNVAELLKVMPGAAGPAGGGAPTATPRLRDYFPETLLWRPEILTAPNGTATVRFTVADSLTTWQLAASASTLGGNTGAGLTQFATFQPFFAAFDPPPALTVGDTLALPVPLRNYTANALQVHGSLTPAPWFRVDSAPTTTPVPAQDSASPVFRFTAIAAATGAQQEFTATAGREGDRIARPVTVHPDGHELAATEAALIEPGANTLTVTVPPGALAGGNSAELKIYPNLAAHLQEALTGLAELPHGCAEQIISAAWPSLLLEQYAANLPAGAKARPTRHYLEEAYANLLADQMQSGAFSYWSTYQRADPALTAYAVRFLTAAGKVIAVDPSVVANALRYLAAQQAGDGRWITLDRDGKPMTGVERGDAMLTASIAANLAETPEAAPVLSKALAGLGPFTAEFDEPYTLASYALAALAIGDKANAGPAIARLRTLALTENGGAYWALETNTPFFGWGRAGRVESSAQVLRALLAAGDKPQGDLVARGFLFLNHEQDRGGLWYSSQATARALDVLAAIALVTPAGKPSAAPLAVQVDTAPAHKISLPPPAKDAGPIFVALGQALGSGSHRVTLTLPAGSSAATAQVVARAYLPWPAAAPVSATTNHEQLRFSLAYSSLTPAPGDPVTTTLHVERIGFRGYGMLLAEIGLPPGAQVDRATLESALSASDGQFNRYEVLPDRVILYLNPQAGGVDLQFAFALRFAVDALAAPSTVYDYYNPDSHFDLRPARFVSSGVR